MRLAGVMLAGGRSIRMGRTKALVDVDGSPMGAHVLSALRDAGCDPVLIYGGDSSELSVLGADVEPDLHPGAGPVGAVAGVLTLLASPMREGGVCDAVAIVACDVPDLDASTLRLLIDTVDREHPDNRVVVARTDRIEPLCAIWPIAVLPAVDSAFASGHRALHRVITDIGAVEVDVPPAALRNVNAPEDLA